MLELRKVVYVDSVPRGQECVLAADIGGTNSNFGFLKVHKNKYVLLFSLHAKSQQVTNFTDLVKQVLDYAHSHYGINVRHSCFAGAGVVSLRRDYCKPTNLHFAIDAKDILANTSLHCAVIANDFEVIGHGISVLSPISIVTISSGAPRHHASRGVIGAGTGLGKCSLLWDAHAQRYMPLSSEGGHADFPAQQQIEFDLIEFIRNEEQCTCNISWEDVLSGNGIKRIYKFFSARNQASKPEESIEQLQPDLIFKNRHTDKNSFDTYSLYQRFYARCAKDFALDALTLGGLYIAGGIAANNLKLFQESAFMQEFINCGKQQGLLRQIPIMVITDYNVSLYGAAAFMELEGLCVM